MVHGMQVRELDARSQRLACEAVVGDNLREDLRVSRARIGTLEQHNQRIFSESLTLKRQIALMQRQIDSGEVRSPQQCSFLSQNTSYFTLIYSLSILKSIFTGSKYPKNYFI